MQYGLEFILNVKLPLQHVPAAVGGTSFEAMLERSISFLMASSRGCLSSMVFMGAGTIVFSSLHVS